MSSVLKYLNPFYYWYEPNDTMMCINSFAKTDKRFNYVIEKADVDEDNEKDIEDYLDPINR